MDFANRRLYLCTPDRPDLAEFLQEVITSGVDVVQLRDKHADAAVILDRAALALDICRKNGVPFILNDRPDLALFLDADGVHVGQDDAPPSLCRSILGPNKVIGLSTHAVGELDRALDEDVTYLSAGPVEATPTKPGREAVGLRYVTEAVSRATVPVFVTGGVTASGVPALAHAGVRHFVVVRALTEAEHPGLAAEQLRQAIDRYVN